MDAMDTESTIEHSAVQHHAVAMALEMPEILEKIFCYLVKHKPTDLINSALVCRKWRDAAYHPSLWRRRSVPLFLKPSDTVQLLPSLAKRRIYEIDLMSVEVHMRDLLPSLPSLKSFHFSPMPCLGGLTMTDTMLCDALQQRHTGLTCFVLFDCTEVTDSSVTLLTTRLPNLEILGLTKCPLVTDVGFVAAACGLPRLYDLCVCCSAITDAGVTELALRRPEEAPGTLQLRELNMSSSGITDVALLHISTVFPKLEVLLVRGCVQLTDAGLEHLVNMGSLKYIAVERCKGITKDRLTQLRLQLKLHMRYTSARRPW